MILESVGWLASSLQQMQEQMQKIDNVKNEMRQKRNANGFITDKMRANRFDLNEMALAKIAH